MSTKTLAEWKNIYEKLDAESREVKEIIHIKSVEVAKYLNKYIRSQIKIYIDTMHFQFSSEYEKYIKIYCDRFLVYLRYEPSIEISSYGQNLEDTEIEQTNLAEIYKYYKNPENLKNFFDKLIRIKKLCENTNYLDNLPKAYTFILCSPFPTSLPRDITKIIIKKILFFL